MASQQPEIVSSKDNNVEAQHTEFQSHLTGKFLNEDAKQATIDEHALGLWQGLKTYRKAAFWSVLVSSSIIMEGYDTTLIGSFFAYPAFQKKFGKDYGGTAGFQLSAPWQAGISDIQAIGNIIGALANGYFTNKYGHRKVMLVNLVLMTGFIFITFFAQNVETVLIGAFFCSIPWGCFATMGPAYAAEVCPLALRGYLTAFVNLCWATGQLLSAAILKGLVNNTTQWSYRIPFAVQWVWVLPLLIGAYFCPESPWFLVRANRLEEAEHSLKRLAQTSDNVDHQKTIALMVHTTALEKEEKLGTGYLDLFRGTNRRRTEIAIGAFVSQVTDGGALVYSPTYFFEQTGINFNTSYGIGLGGTGIAFVGTCISWIFMTYYGRRSIFLTGFYILITCLYLIAILDCIPHPHESVKYVQATLSLIWLGSYSATVGPIVYTIVAEIGSTRLRTKTVVIGRSSYYVANIIGQVLEPYMINPTEWNFKGKTAFFWGTASLLTTIWAFFRLPETKDRTFEELDIMFIKKVSARKFSEQNLEDDDMFDRVNVQGIDNVIGKQHL